VTQTDHERRQLCWAASAHSALRSKPRASCCAVTTMPLRLRAAVALQEHPDRLLDHLLGRNGYASRPVIQGHRDRSLSIPMNW
jgi:hypothetical protein